MDLDSYRKEVMPRKEKFPYSHFVDKTRKEHECGLCWDVIRIGEHARYKNLSTGERGYVHGNWPYCYQNKMRAEMYGDKDS
jgi:hypothetical protein